MNSLVERKISPMHREGYPFMWYIKLNDGSCIYEFDDRKVEHWTDKIRNKYIDWLEKAKQSYYRREISLGTNLKRIAMELFDNILMLFNPNTPNGNVREASFDRIYSVNKEKIQELGIMGNGGSLHLDTNTGRIYLASDMFVELYMVYNGIKIPITGQINLKDEKNDLIERHEISYEFDLASAKHKSISGHILGWTIGYKGEFEVKNVNGKDNKIMYTILYTLPLDRPNFITVSLNSTYDMDAELHLTYLANDDKTTVQLLANQDMSFMIAF